MKRIRYPLFLAAFFFLAGCVTTAKQACLDELKARYPAYTDDERLALFYGAKGVGCIQEWFFEVERKDGKPGIPQIAYRKIKLDQILAVERKQLKDAEEVLDTSPKNERIYRILEEMGLRPYFEAQERALKFRVARLELKINHEEFLKLLGEVDASQESEKRRKAYTAQIFLPQFDPSRDTPFTAKYVEDAKRDGKLVFIGMTTIFDHQLLGKKEPDPEFPSDTNRFVWKETTEGLEVRLFKVVNSERPRDKKPHYLEATRVVHRFDKAGALIATERELKPALRIFASPAETLDIVVLDTDQEGDLGFGLPDVVEKLLSGIETGKELYLSHQSLLAKLFTERLAEKRRPLPTPKPQKLETAAAGTPVDPWEKAPTAKGWSVPHQYQSERKDNYHLEIILKSKNSSDSSSLRQIDFISKVYHSASNEWQPAKGGVVEHYRPLSPFGEKNILEARTDYVNKKKIVVEREGQPSISGIVNPGKNTFTEERPFAIDFTDGATRWRMVDRDKSGTFMYRMEISPVRINGSGESSGGSYSE